MTGADQDATPDDGRPFAWGEGDTAVVLLHGLTGTPWEVRPLAAALHADGHAVEAPLLAGHDSVEALEHSTWAQWYATAEVALDAHRHAGRRVLILGFSMGGLLALLLAARRPEDVAGLIVISVPLQLPPWQRRAITGLSRLRRQPLVGRLVGHLDKDGPDLRVEAERERSPSLSAFPYPTLLELVRLQDEVRRALPRVRAPILLLHGRHDHAAPVTDSARIAQAVASPEVRRVILPRSFHIVGRDLDREQACQEVVRFARHILGSRPPNAETNP